jgi:hypothetical protein
MSKEQLSTSGNEIPKHKNALEEKYQSKESHVKRLDQDNIQNQWWTNYQNHLVGEC